MGKPYLRRLAAEHHARLVQRLPQTAVEEGHADAVARQDEVQNLHRLREQDAVMLVDRQPLRRRVSKQRLEVAALLRHDRYRALIELDRVFAASEEPRHLVAGKTGRSHHQRDVEFVVVENLLAKHLRIAVLERAREGGVEVAPEHRVGRSTHEMRPQRDTIIADRPPGDVELVVPGVEVGNVAGLERPPIDPVHAHQRAVFECDDRVIDVPRIGDELDVVRLSTRDLLVPQCGVSHCRTACA